MNVKQKVEKMLKAMKKMEEAAELLQEVADDNETMFIKWDAKHFSHELNELLSCDNGEAGLQPFLHHLANKMDIKVK